MVLLPGKRIYKVENTMDSLKLFDSSVTGALEHLIHPLTYVDNSSKLPPSPQE